MYSDFLLYLYDSGRYTALALVAVPVCVGIGCGPGQALQSRGLDVQVAAGCAHLHRVSCHGRSVPVVVTVQRHRVSEDFSIFIQTLKTNKYFYTLF